MNCWAILQLSEDADERTVKRSYARLLKIHRPDDDPVAFQRLRDAYEQALRIAKRSAATAIDNDPPAPPVRDAPNLDALTLVQRKARPMPGFKVAKVPGAELQLDEEPKLSAEPQPDEESEFSAEPQPDVELEFSAQPHPYVKPKTSAEPQPELEPEPSAESKLDAKVEPAAEPELAFSGPELNTEIENKARVIEALMADLQPDNLMARWELATLQDCHAEFERALLILCLASPNQWAGLAEWGVVYRQWLMPGQALVLNAAQQHSLTVAVLRLYASRLRFLFAEKSEDDVFELLRTYVSLVWLQSFDRRMELEQMVAVVFDQHAHWSPGLFEQVCRLFGWDESKGIVPEPAPVWERVSKRYADERYFARLESWAQSPKLLYHGTSEQKAAHLLLGNSSLFRKARAVRSFSATDWQACYQLQDMLVYRYPQHHQRWPDADITAWRRFLPITPAPSVSWRVAVLMLFCSAIFGLAHWHNFNDAWGGFIVLAFVTIFTRLLVRRALVIWHALIWDQLLFFDMKFTQWCMPRKFKENVHWRLLTNGLPWLFGLALAGLNLGVVGLMIYLGVDFLDSVAPFKEPANAERLPQWRKSLLEPLRALNCSYWHIAFFALMMGVLFVGERWFRDAPGLLRLPGLG